MQLREAGGWQIISNKVFTSHISCHALLKTKQGSFFFPFFCPPLRGTHHSSGLAHGGMAWMVAAAKASPSVGTSIGKLASSGGSNPSTRSAATTAQVLVEVATGPCSWCGRESSFPQPSPVLEMSPAEATASPALWRWILSPRKRICHFALR